jgi:uncharacterized protein (UPF0147 family)
MKMRVLLVAPLLLVMAATGCSMIPGTPANRAMRDVSRLRKMKDPTDKIPRLVDYLGYRGFLQDSGRVAGAAKDGIVETGYPAILYLDAAMHDPSRNKQARTYLLRAYTEIERTGAVLKLLDMSRDANQPVYLRVESIKLLADLKWKDAKPYFKHLSEDEREPKEVRKAAKRAAGRL